MKHLCCSKIILFCILLGSTLFASLESKSAIVYLGKEISYPMVGIHDYIIVDPEKTNVYTHGFALYKTKIYARIEIRQESQYQQLLEQLKNYHKQGFENFFLDLGAHTDSNKFTNILQKIKSNQTLQHPFLLVGSHNNTLVEKLAPYCDGLVLFNLSKNQEVQQWIQTASLNSTDIIDIEFDMSLPISKLTSMGVIPYLTNSAMDIYGKSTKNAVKREIFTLIDESIDDKIVSSAHQYGALPLEYQGYIQKLYDVRRGLPNPNKMTQYAGVVIWLTVDSENPAELIEWVKELIQHHIPVAFASGFGFPVTQQRVLQLGISTYDGKENSKKKVIVKDSMMGYELQPTPSADTLYFQPPKGSKPLFTYQDEQGLTSTLAAITPWGGYAIANAFLLELNGENIWTINPFKFFAQALRLKKLPVPDPTTENGSRLFFTHIDGDGIMNGVEFNPELVSGDIIYKEILKKYPIPHSVSIIGAEVMPNGLYPKQSKRFSKIAHNFYALPNVEPATHTFTHPFFWGKIKNDSLPEEYRLKPKGYKFSLAYEFNGSLGYIQNKLLDKHSSKRAKTVFWSGDCAPRINALSYLYKHHILNLNGGYTTINNATPWLTLVAPLGIERGEYYQIYTAAQNENVFTNDWLGPFWGFKKVVQTFKLTNSPKRLKPIDVYYHLYSGSKKASLNAVRYVLDWVMQQKDILPIFASEYIPKAMDYFTVSMAHEGNRWLVDGMKNLKTLRIEEKNGGVHFQHSPSVVGIKHFENHTFIALDQHIRHTVQLSSSEEEDVAFLVNANAQLVSYTKDGDTKQYQFQGHMPLKLTFHSPQGCRFSITPHEGYRLQHHAQTVQIDFKSAKKVRIDVQCK